MFIGELARRSQVSVKALRLYESLGLLGPVRRQGKYRLYDDAYLHQVQLIRHAQRLGFRLAELQALIRQQDGTLDWTGVLAQLAQKSDALAHEIQRLEGLQRELRQLHAELRACLSMPNPMGNVCI